MGFLWAHSNKKMCKCCLAPFENTIGKGRNTSAQCMDEALIHCVPILFCFIFVQNGTTE